MSKQYLDKEVALPLLDKIINDTKAGKITWEMKPVDNDVEIPEHFQVALTTARPDYRFQAKLGENFYCNFQHQNSLYFIWFVNAKSGFACFDGHLFKTPGFSDRVIKLADAIREATYDEKGILNDIGAYIKG